MGLVIPLLTLLLPPCSSGCRCYRLPLATKQNKNVFGADQGAILRRGSNGGLPRQMGGRPRLTFGGRGVVVFVFVFASFFFPPFTGSLSVEESDGTPEGGGRKENFDFFAGYVFSKVLFLAGVLASDFWPLETLALFSTACTVCFILFVSFLPQNVGQVQHEAARHAEFVKCPSH